MFINTCRFDFLAADREQTYGDVFREVVVELFNARLLLLHLGHNFRESLLELSWLHIISHVGLFHREETQVYFSLLLQLAVQVLELLLGVQRDLICVLAEQIELILGFGNHFGYQLLHLVLLFPQPQILVRYLAFLPLFVGRHLGLVRPDGRRLQEHDRV